MQFDEGIPDQCPPADADPTPDTVYRALKGRAVTDGDFLSWVMDEVPSAKAANCKHWGLSVWRSQAAVEHARDTYPSLEEKYIAKGELEAGDGVVKSTPSKAQPEHCTFWYDINVDLKRRFTIYLEPSVF